MGVNDCVGDEGVASALTAGQALGHGLDRRGRGSPIYEMG